MSLEQTSSRTAAAEPASVSVEGLRIGYGALEVVKGLDLRVAQGEIITLLGPSGCGKTTTLRAIAGFVSPSHGAIRLHGRDVTDIAPNKRNIGLVFQGYALFPHMSVFDNVAYGLRMRKVPAPEIRERVERALKLVKLERFAERRPRELSGGQQQRVAIARAVVIEPAVLLLDEPLSNLDAKLRHEMRVELRRLLKEMGIASIFVTHDQEEAIVLSDRVVLMNEGRIEQEGTPQTMYNRPGSLFAAAFLGQANFLRGTVASLGADGTAIIDIDGDRFQAQACGGLKAGAPATLVVKCERLRLDRSGRSQAQCTFEAANFLGPSVQLQCSFKGQRLVGLLPASTEGGAMLEPGAPVTLSWGEADGLIFPRAD
ncbi:ABC transporter ATP-binding protein [Bosea caraganae]|uniref:ABC transporter ATP-binding protein n=1 Tax=Bosea caraganae TaxID=2763117 RepID=A0A370LD39_9HYPH|nr:ABC transporter ATP-binding protein [Bosea caraganae]RDJ27746.1 ABC transporter ATP-binding protein [Bosea caraganae]RDJ29759.1 ABC transporter ATP-binding protein [Bosea caraganae]